MHLKLDARREWKFPVERLHLPNQLNPEEKEARCQSLRLCPYNLRPHCHLRRLLLSHRIRGRLLLKVPGKGDRKKVLRASSLTSGNC